MKKVLPIVSIWLVGLLLFVGLFLSLWIIVPAPIFSLLPLSVGAPEISPGLLLLNILVAIAIVTIFWLRGFRYWRLFLFTLSLSGLALGLSARPLLQFSTVQQQAQAAIESSLGRDYLKNIPPEIMPKLRSQPLIIADIWRKIPIPKVRIDRAIPFANPDGVKLTMNIYRPLQVGKYPAIVSIYGGAWQRGSPDSDDTFNRYIAAQGYVVWAIDYRHAPAYRFPTQIEDVRSALTFIKKYGAENETDLDRVALIGRSAGAQLATLAAYQDPPLPIRAVVNYYGPVNLTAGYEDVPTPDPIESRATLRAFLGGTPQTVPELYRQASPINAVKPALPPSLLIYGGKDHIIESKYGKYLAQQLRSQGNRTIFIEIPWADHAFDAVFSGVSNQLALYYTERFLAWALIN
ncbi:alpha/beta hydrolase [Chamaesiphon minutus]|uniref:Esterase/lipase n=1 Tax=Chamaesiphon minutus (strain ATCC 27169 / PCC 6605) TaxID=1173020 RepID=K9UAU9_CHAP6|nr:alpha/beta hydrolase [Chamaesiphon minutus]AFY91753.1 esterase/lipase [Chamaesiphon minutus PCC 6605]